MIVTFFVFIHVLSAILSIGPLFVLLPMLKKMEETPESQLDVYVQFFQIIITIVKHAGHVLVLSGAVLIGISSWKWTTSWIVLTIALMVVSIVFLARAFKPTLKTFKTPQFHKTWFIQKLRRATWKYIALLLIMLWLMIAKPVFW